MGVPNKPLFASAPVSSGDLPAERRKAREIVPSLEQATRKIYEERKATWKKSNHTANGITTLETDVFPAVGDRRVDHLETQDILCVLAQICLMKPETASRVRERMSTVLGCGRAVFKCRSNSSDQWHYYWFTLLL